MPTQFTGKSAAEAARPKVGEIDNRKCYRNRDEALAEIERECNVRFKCFDRWIADGKMSYTDAKDRIERLISAWHWLSDSEEARQFALDEANAAPEHVTSTGDKTPF